MKKILFGLLLISCSLFLTGCIDIKVDEELTLNTDKTMTHSVKLLASDTACFVGDTVMDSFRDALKNNGFETVVPAREINYFGMKGVNQLEKISSIGGINKFFSVTDNSLNFFIFKYYNITVNADLSSLFSDVDNDVVTLSEYKFTLNLPVKIFKSNAYSTFNDEKSAVWYLATDGQSILHVEFIVFDLVCSLIFLGVIILAILFSVFVVTKKDKHESKIDQVKEIIKSTDTNNENTENETLTSSYCSNCGASVSEEDMFCGECGAKLK